MAQAPLREHYSSDEEYFRELDIYNTQVQSDLENFVSGGSDVQTGTDDEDYPTVGGLRVGYQDRYLSVKYGTSSTGANFTDDYTTISVLTVFQGLRNTATNAESTNPADYTWRELNVASGWKPNYRIAGGRIVDWDFSNTTPSNYIVDDGSISPIDLDNFGVGAKGDQGNPGDNGLTVLLTSSIGTTFRNNAGNPAIAKATVYDGGAGALPDNTHNTLNYKWVEATSGNTICVLGDRSVINSGNGILTSSNGTTCTTGVPADSSVTTSLGSSLREVILGPEDVHLMASLFCDVSNIP